MFKPIIGLEIHAELKTKSKMFCSCPNDPDIREPNVNICPVCLGYPGVLPVINQKAVEYVVKTGLFLHSEISSVSKFDRKNYFYPDLPKGYQISQYDQPLCLGGYLEIPEEAKSDRLSQNKFKRIRIRRIHLEEDTGRLIHPKGVNYSLVDFNRAGVPLMELVTEPDIHSGWQARKFCEELQLILRYLGVSGADMEKGQMRCEVNISLLDLSQDKNPERAFGTKVEIKNLNSFRAVENAVNYEIKRQAELLKSGEKVVQETRGWDEAKHLTFSQRVKEEVHDYRYFPEPDLPPLILKEAADITGRPLINLASLVASLPELPQLKRQRFSQQYKLSLETIDTLTKNKELADYFENIISELENWFKAVENRKMSDDEFEKLVKLTANYLVNEIPRIADELKVDRDEVRQRITPENFAEFVNIIREGKVSSSGAQILLKEMFKTKADPSHIIEEKDLRQINDSEAFTEIIKKIINNNQKAVEDYRKGKKNSLQYLIGQVMKETKGKANPQLIAKILEDELRDIDTF